MDRTRQKQLKYLRTRIAIVDRAIAEFELLAAHQISALGALSSARGGYKNRWRCRGALPPRNPDAQCDRTLA
jgi:hypothetical protein